MCWYVNAYHSKNNQIAFAAVAAGAEIVEKHIALKEKKKGLDYEFSLKGHEIKTIHIVCRLNWKTVWKTLKTQVLPAFEN